MPTGKVLNSHDTPNDALTIVRDFYLLLEYVEQNGPESVYWDHYKRRCRACLTAANVWGFEPPESPRPELDDAPPIFTADAREAFSGVVVDPLGN